LKIRRILGALFLLAAVLILAFNHTSVQACHAGDINLVPGTCSSGSLGKTTITGLFNGGNGYRGTVTIDGTQVYQEVYSGSDIDHAYDLSRVLTAGSHTVVATLEQGGGTNWTKVGSPITKTFSVVACPTSTSTSTATVTKTATATLTATPTETNTPTVTNTFTATPTETQVSTSTPTVTDTPTETKVPTKTFTPTATPTGTQVSTPTFTVTSTQKATLTPTITSTSTVTSTPTKSPTVLTVASPTPTPSAPIETGAGDRIPFITYLGYIFLGLALILIATSFKK